MKIINDQHCAWIKDLHLRLNISELKKDTKTLKKYLAV